MLLVNFYLPFVGNKKFNKHFFQKYLLIILLKYILQHYFTKPNFKTKNYVTRERKQTRQG